MRAFAVLAGLALLAAAPAAAQGGKKKATVTIENESEWTLVHFYLSSMDDEEWGEDQLGEHVIKKGESFKLADIPCDSYDVRLVDEDGDECVLTEVDLCGAKETWTITSKELLQCQAVSE